jgi:hypothetical protein
MPSTTVSSIHSLNKAVKRYNELYNKQKEREALRQQIRQWAPFEWLGDECADTILWWNEQKEKEREFSSYDHGSYYDEDGDPFDSDNAANWDGDQQIGFRD